MLSPEVRSLILKGKEALLRERTFSPYDMEERASGLLMVNAEIAQVVHAFEDRKVELKTLQECMLKESMDESVGKTVVERKLSAECNKKYISAREQYELLEADLSELKTLSKIFENAHIMWRQIMKPQLN